MTIQAADAANVARNITLSGSIADDTAVNGPLTKPGGGILTHSGPVSYSGATLVSAGKLVVGSTHSGTDATTVSANAALGVTASGTSQWQPAALPLANPCTREFTRVTKPGTLNSSIQIGTNSLGKADTGTWTLASTNTCTGNTNGGGGTHIIAVASIAANSTVSVSGSGVLQLDLAGTNIVAGLSTNNVSLAPGIYSSNNVAPCIAGSGSLQAVAPGPSGPATRPTVRAAGC